MANTRRPGPVHDGGVYHIFAAQRQRQYGLPTGKTSPGGHFPRSPEPTRHAWSSLRLPSSAASAAWIRPATSPLAGGGLDLVAAGDQVAGARLEAEPVEHRLAQRRLDPLAEIGGT